MRPRGRGYRLSRYVLIQLLGPVALLTLLLTSVIWLVTILPLLDLVITKGQSAGTFLYLASDKASAYVTGQTIEVNGGQLMA